MLLLIHPQTSSCKHARHAAAAAHIAYIKLPTADLYGWSWGRWKVSHRVLQDLLKANTEPYYLKVEQQAHLAAESAEVSQLVPCGDDVIVCRLH